jgi:hypothetical protein
MWRFFNDETKSRLPERSAIKKSRVMIEIDSIPKGELKALGGGDRDQWNARISELVLNALPVDPKNVKAASDVGSAVAAGVVDMRPSDPIEGVLISQIVTANEAALEFYRRGWTNTRAGYFDAGTKYLQLADKASRTVALLTERLDQHRGRGQQQITVKHVTVNADQAVVTDQIVTDKGKETIATKSLTAGTDKAMGMLEPKPKEAMFVEGGGSKAK